MSPRLIAVLAALIIACAPAAVFAAEKGWFGFALAIDAEGSWFSPKLRSIKIDKVFAGSPAGNAGLEIGDDIVEIEGITVAGAKADTVKAAVQKSVGETLRLKYQRGTGALREVALIAAAKPPS
jgi:C-terminal processing protease CtpA/Prc